MRYGAESRLCAFIARRRLSSFLQYFDSNNVQLRPPASGVAVIFLPGMTDGLLALDYMVPLNAMLAKMKIALVQPLLSSSYFA